MRVAASLGVPFVTLDAETEYKQGVIDYLLREYAAGRTPNPDVMCNREVKFGAFYRFAKEKGADYIATGHYARVEDGHLYRGRDEAKDQSYFLWAVPEEALKNTLFPLGSMQKADTRRLAQTFKLPNAAKRDSQGICFLGSISVEDFLAQEFATVLGEAFDTKGELVGTHNGAVLHTLGSRVALTDAAPGPWYVVRKDMRANTLTVSHERAEGVHTGAIRLTETNILRSVSADTEISMQYRYHGPRIKGCYRAAQESFEPGEVLPEPLAPGQSLVLYDRDEVIGGGIIAEDAIMS